MRKYEIHPFSLAVGGVVAVVLLFACSGGGSSVLQQGPIGPTGPQGPQGPIGNDGAQGPPGPGSGCVNCEDIETVAFTAVCKIFADDISNTSEVSICVGVIADLILVDADVCAPNETDCLSAILDNVEGLIQEKANNP